MRKRDKALEIIMEKLVMIYFILYYLIGLHFNLLPSLTEIENGTYSVFQTGMMAVYLIVVVVSQYITVLGVGFFTKDKPEENDIGKEE